MRAECEATGRFQSGERAPLMPEARRFVIDGECMTLTVKEKEHWKQSIERKVKRAIDELYAQGEPGLQVRIEKEAKQKAFESLGIREWQERLVHELAHELLHRGDRRASTTKVIRETEAETPQPSRHDALPLSMEGRTERRL